MMVKTMMLVAGSALALLLALVLPAGLSQLIEDERVKEYHKRGYSFPPKFVPDTPGWSALFSKRIAQIQQIEDSNAKYNGWIETMTAGVLAPNFTESGWGLTRAPEDLMQALRKGIREGLPAAREEHSVDVIYGPPCLFIDRPDLVQRILTEMKPILEAWSGVELVPYRAYGFRLYRNESRLLMHVDKTQTHVISCILHIDSSEDAEPWPIVIEDFEGNLNEAILTSGDVLLYESSKCFHGRPKALKGSWYTSVFVHYFPKGEWQKTDHEMESHYAIPPTWNEIPQAEVQYPKLKVVGTGMEEPECPDIWCDLNNTVKWKGPAEKDFVITTGNKKFNLYESRGSAATTASREEL